VDIVTGVRRYLLGHASIAALVAQRIYTPILPQKVTFPAIQLQLISDIDALHLRGPIGLPTDRIQLDAWAMTRDSALGLGRLCRQRLNGFAGAWVDASTSPEGRLVVQVIRWDDSGDRFEPDLYGGLCRHSSDYWATFRDLTDEVLI
jgi:hypothetical protein